MLPSLTETAWVLGIGSRLVGVDRYSNWPADIAGLPHMGGLDDAQIAAICRTRAATCATRNTKDFAHTGIDLVDPWAW